MPKDTLMIMHWMRIIGALACASIVFWAAVPATAQQSPVYVDDSPLAWELFREAQQQAGRNVSEAVRLYQEILDDLALRLIPADDQAANRLQAARLRVLDQLIADRTPGGLLERYRAMEHGQALRLHQGGEFDRLVLTRPWTQPGLDALLRLAQQHIESAQFNAASNLLQLVFRHPDFSADSKAAAHAWYMQAIADHCTDDSEGFLWASHQLEQLAEDSHRVAHALLEKLHHFTDEQLPEIPFGLSPLDVGTVSPNVPLEQLVAEEIWSVALEETLYQRRFVQNTRRVPRRGRDVVLEEGLVMTAAPTVLTATNTNAATGGPPGLVYINQGHHIMALDRFTGSPMWPMVGGFVERSPLTIIDYEDDHARDLNVIAVENDVLVTLTGHAHVANRSNDGAVLCLDAYTGMERWATRIDTITGPGIDADEHEGLFPHSAPIIAEGKVFVLARKVSAQSVTSAYLVALNIEDGSLAWIRHIASSGSVRRSARAFSSLVYADGDLYLNSAVGAVARVEAATGQVRWLHRFAVALNPAMSEQMRRPWELNAPVLTPQHVVSLLPGLGGTSTTGSLRILVLDRETGMEVVSYDPQEIGWGSPAYLATPGEGSPWIYAIGRDIRAIHVDALDRAAWTLTEANDAQSLVIQGRVHVVNHHGGGTDNVDAPQHPALVVPDQSGILIVDGVTGEIINRLLVYSSGDQQQDERAELSSAIRGAMGNPVVVDSQLFIADNTQLRSFMAMEHAVHMLRDRMDASPIDPEAGLALLRLAIASCDSTRNPDSNFDLIMTAAQSVLRSIELATSPETAMQIQGRLFALLLELDVDVAAGTHEQGQAIFAVMRQVIAAAEQLSHDFDDSAQQLDYLLAYGDWLSQQEGGTSAAIDTYRSILTQPAIANVKRIEGHVIRPGRAWAMQRLFAHDEIGNSPGIMPAPHAVTPELPRLGLQDGPAMLLSGALIRSAAADSACDALPSPTNHASVLLYGDQLLQLHESTASSAGSDLSPRWTIDLSGTDVVDQISNASRAWDIAEDRILLWLEERGVANRANGRFVMTDRDAGDILWLSPTAETLFGHARRYSNPASQGRRTMRQPGRPVPNEEPQSFDPAGIVPLVSSDRALIVRHDGAVAMFSLEDGSEPAWLLQRALQQVHHAAICNDVLVLAGIASGSASSGGGGGSASPRPNLQAPVLLAVDLATGELIDDVLPLAYSDAGREFSRHSLQEQAALGAHSASISWMAVDSSGLLVCGTPGGVQAWNMIDRAFLWKNTAPRARNSQQGWFAAEQVFIQTNDGQLRSINLHDATVSPPLVPPIAASFGYSDDSLIDYGEIRNVMPYGADALGEQQRVLVHCSQRIGVYDGAGGALGFDAIQDNRNFRWVMPAHDRIIAVSAHQPRQEPIPGRESEGRRTHYLYSIYSLSENGKLLDEPLQLPVLFEPLRDAQLLDGWLVLSTATHTLAVPFPANHGS